MKSTFTLLQASLAALVLTFTFGCAPPEVAPVDTTIDVVEPSSNTTTSAEVPVVEAPSDEELTIDESVTEEPVTEVPAE